LALRLWSKQTTKRAFRWLPLDAYQLKRARSRLTLGCIPDEERSTALQHEGGAFSSVAPQTKAMEQKFHLPVECVAQGLGTQGDVMTTLQAICLGAMLSWTPSLVVLAALLLREAPLEELERDPS
ncbi:MAG TPA: hypothetical protein VK567_16840, partial [Bradyrhizobium sp.]|nr:hypothetical protein [Bradyrhizobium sp.]